MATISTNTNFTVPDKNGSYDGSMVVKQYKSLTIDSGVTVSVDQPCRGLAIFVQGDCTINGILSMSNKGAERNPTSTSNGEAVNANGLQYGFFQTGGTDTLSAITFNGCLATGTGNPAGFAHAPTLSSGSNYKKITHPRVGGAGATVPTSGTAWASSNQVAGTAGTGGQTGGGGSGGYGEIQSSSSNKGHGGDGTCFSGGSGGGGMIVGTETGSPAANDFGGAGGGGGTGTGVKHCTGGGAGHPSGSSYDPTGYWADVGTGDGGGGLLYLIVGGNLTIGSSGQILSKGGDAAGINGTGGSNSWRGCAGGASGGGAIVIICKGSYSAASGSVISANGGSGGVSTNGADSNTNGGDGGNGTIQTYTSNVL